MMTEKRFERWNDHSCKVKDNQEDTFLNWEDVVNKLNEQYNEIKKLKRMCEMGEKRYSLGEVGWYYTKLIIDNETKHELGNSIVVKTLNEQQSIIKQLQEENKELKHWKKRIIEYLTDWFNKTEYLSVLNKITEINNEIGLDYNE